MKRLVLTSSITSIMSGNDEGRLGPDSWSETNAYSDSGEAPEGISTNIPRGLVADQCPVSQGHNGHLGS
ncbi:MAG: hypothetical protein ACJAY5_001698 [Actinomycetes bacterium]|jgi:hypothetical protein